MKTKVYVEYIIITVECNTCHGIRVGLRLMLFDWISLQLTYGEHVFVQQLKTEVATSTSFKRVENVFLI
jgi:hypothetical protein